MVGGSSGWQAGCVWPWGKSALNGNTDCECSLPERKNAQGKPSTYKFLCLEI